MFLCWSSGESLYSEGGHSALGWNDLGGHSALGWNDLGGHSALGWNDLGVILP